MGLSGDPPKEAGVTGQLLISSRGEPEQNWRNLRDLAARTWVSRQGLGRTHGAASVSKRCSSPIRLH